MKILIRCLFILFIINMAGCDDYQIYWKDKPYEVLWIDDPNQIVLNYDIGNGGSIRRIEPKVIAIGSDSDYIVVKRKELLSKKIDYYYIVKKEDRPFTENAVYGPFNENEFLQKTSVLKLPSFSKKFDN